MSFLSSCAVITPHPSLSSSTQPGKGNDLCFLFCDAVLSLHQNPVSQSTQSAIVITLLAGVLGPRQERANQWPSLRWNVLPLGARRSRSPTREQWARANKKAWMTISLLRRRLRESNSPRLLWWSRALIYITLAEKGQFSFNSRALLLLYFYFYLF